MELTKAVSYRSAVTKMWEQLSIFKADAILRLDYYICIGARVMDFNGSVDLEQIRDYINKAILCGENEFLRNNNLEELPPRRIDIKGDDLFLNVQEYDTIPLMM